MPLETWWLEMMMPRAVSLSRGGGLIHLSMTCGSLSWENNCNGPFAYVKGKQILSSAAEKLSSARS